MISAKNMVYMANVKKNVMIMNFLHSIHFATFMKNKSLKFWLVSMRSSLLFLLKPQRINNYPRNFSYCM